MRGPAMICPVPRARSRREPVTPPKRSHARPPSLAVGGGHGERGGEGIHLEGPVPVRPPTDLRRPP